MIRFSGTPVIIEDDGMLFQSSGAVDPHITLVTGTPAIADHFEGSFVRMDQVRAGQKPVEFLIEDVQVDLCGAHHPVGHGAHPQGKSGDDGQTLIASDPPVRFYGRRNAGS